MFTVTYYFNFIFNNNLEFRRQDSPLHCEFRRYEYESYGKVLLSNTGDLFDEKFLRYDEMFRRPYYWISTTFL